MMKKGVMTVYFSLVFMLVMSFLLVLLESDRLYILRTEGERYADMAAEMVFAGYIQPLADYYSLFGVNHGEKNSQLEKFDDYLKLNITGEEKPQLGNIAYRTGKKLSWDGKSFHDTEADKLLCKEYRAPWELPKI